MKTPNIIALPTSQMEALCDVLELPKSVQDSTESMIVALEDADFSGLKVVKPVASEQRRPNTIGFEPDKVDPDIVEARKVKLGR